MKCTACNKELNKKEAMYTEDRKPYCSNPFTCNELHPNSVQNIVARGGAVNLYTEDELEENLFDKLDVSEEMKDRIQKVATKPQSIRLSKVEIAYYLLQLQEAKEFGSISEAVRYCVTRTMEAEPIESEPTELTYIQKETLKANTGHSVPGPKPEGIKIDLRDPITNPEPLPEPKEEDEFTF